MSTPGRTLVLGVANPWRRDDGAGPAVVDRLRGRLGPADAADLAIADGEPTRLLETWAGYRTVILVDASLDEPPRPGVVREPAPGAAKAGRPTGGSHALGVAAAVELATALGRAPTRLLVLTVGGADFGTGPGLSPEVAAAVDVAAARVLALVRGRR